MKQALKRLLESTLGVHIYRGWFPRGMNLVFDRCRLISAARPVLFDVGANVGSTALELAKQHPSAVVHAFEPVNDTFRMLAVNTRSVPRIIPHAMAVGASSGISEIQLYEGTVNNSLKLNPDSAPRGVEQVRVVTLDSFCTQERISQIDFLKIDTEGGDLEVIRGAQNLFQEHRISVVLAELGFSRCNRKHVPFGVFLQEMQDREMELFGVYDQRREFDGIHALRRADCMFVCRHHHFRGLEDAPDA